MVEVVDSGTGEVREFSSLNEAAEQGIERPPYWRRAAHSFTPTSVDEGEWGREFDEAFLTVQEEVGPLIWADSDNEFNKSKYASLGALLANVQPTLIKNKLKLNQGAGKVNIRGDLQNKIFLPIWTRITHVPTGQWQRVWVEMPMIKFDAQGYGSTMTYGRRYALVSYLGLAATDDDGVWASSKPALDEDDLTHKIAKCETEADLRTWHTKHEQHFASLDKETLGRLKDVWQRRLAEVKNVPVEGPKPAKKGIKND